MDQVDQLQNQLLKAASGSEDAVELLNLNILRWELTLEEMTMGEIPSQRLDMIDRTILQVDSVRRVLQNGLREILVQQDRLVDKRNILESFIEEITDQKLLIGENLFTRDMPGFFSELSSLGDSALVRQHFDQLKRSIRSGCGGVAVRVLCYHYLYHLPVHLLDNICELVQETLCQDDLH